MKHKNQNTNSFVLFHTLSSVVEKEDNSTKDTVEVNKDAQCEVWKDSEDDFPNQKVSQRTKRVAKPKVFKNNVTYMCQLYQMTTDSETVTVEEALSGPKNRNGDKQWWRNINRSSTMRRAKSLKFQMIQMLTVSWCTK